MYVWNGHAVKLGA